MIFLFIVATWHGIMAKLGSQHAEPSELDENAFYVCIAIWFSFQTIFILTVFGMGYKKRREVRAQEKQYLADYAKLQAKPAAPSSSASSPV